MDDRIFVIGVAPRVFNKKLIGFRFKIVDQEMHTRWVDSDSFDLSQYPVIPEVMNAIQINENSYSEISNQ